MNNYLIEKLASRYDPENDIPPAWPNITWTEWALLEIIKDLQQEIKSLNERLEVLEIDKDRAGLAAVPGCGAG